MIAAVCDPRRDGKSSFKTLKEYLVDKLRVDDWKAGVQSHLNDDGSTYLITESGVAVEHNGFDIDTLVQEFESVISMKPNVEDPIYHMVISWGEKDSPSDEQIFDCAKEAIKTLGFDGHQYLNAIHRDTDNPHVHLAINRIHPESYKVVNPYYDYYILGSLMTELESKYGFQIDNQGGVKKTLTDSDNGHLDGRDSPVTKVDAHGDISFLKWCKKNVAPIINSVAESSTPSWDELLQKLATIDVQVVPRGGGIVFRSVDSNGSSVAVKASSVGSQFSKSKLDSVFGSLDEYLLDLNNSKTPAPVLPLPSTPSEFKDPNSFLDWAKNELSPQIKKWSSRGRADWESLHKILADNNCQLIQYGQGLAVTPLSDISIQVAASKVHRGLSINNLEKKLGSFSPSNIPSSSYAKARNKTPRRRTSESISKLKKQYQEYRATRPTPEKMRRHLARRIREIRKETQEEIKVVNATMPSAIVRTAYIQELRWQQARRIQGERLRLIQQYNAEQALNVTLGWREWLELEAKMGNEAAKDQVSAWHEPRHKLRASSNSIGPISPPHGSIELAPGAEAMLSWVRRKRRNGTTDFYTSSGDHVLTQQRNGLKIHRVNETSVSAMMQLAIDTYGRELRLTGTDDFKQRAISALVKLEAAGGGRIRLADPDLQKRLEQERQLHRKGVGPRRA